MSDIIAQTFFPGVMVSTVKLWVRNEYETMIFEAHHNDETGNWDTPDMGKDYGCWRYNSAEAAVIGHFEACGMVLTGNLKIQVGHKAVTN